MAHPEQQIFMLEVKIKFKPKYKPFINARVLDCGSLDINGNNRFLFYDCDYLGIDVGAGDNVDHISLIHEYDPGFQYDTIVSNEVFEHDPFWKQSLDNMVKLLKPGGLLIFTCAGLERSKHGTSTHAPHSSPLTVGDDRFNDYYQNLDIQIIGEHLQPDLIFSEWELKYGWEGKDVYFYGIKHASP